MGYSSSRPRGAHSRAERSGAMPTLLFKYIIIGNTGEWATSIIAAAKTCAQGYGVCSIVPQGALLAVLFFVPKTTTWYKYNMLISYS